jgi:hypothetical protein
MLPAPVLYRPPISIGSILPLPVGVNSGIVVPYGSVCCSMFGLIDVVDRQDERGDVDRVADGIVVKELHAGPDVLCVIARLLYARRRRANRSSD